MKHVLSHSIAKDRATPVMSFWSEPRKLVSKGALLISLLNAKSDNLIKRSHFPKEQVFCLKTTG